MPKTKRINFLLSESLFRNIKEINTRDDIAVSALIRLSLAQLISVDKKQK